MQTLFKAIEDSDYLEVKKIMTSNTTLLELEDEQGANLLAFAIRKRVDVEILELLLDLGISIHGVDDEGVNVLEYAITYGNIAFVKRAIEMGVSAIDTNRRSGFTPLMAAVSYNHAEVVTLLLDHGAKLYQQDRSGFTAVDFAHRMHRKKIAAILEKYIESQKEDSKIE